MEKEKTPEGKAEAPSQGWAPFDSAGMVTLGKAVHGCIDPFEARLQLQRQIQRIMPRLMQVAAVEPEVFLLGWLPHVPQFALVGARIIRGSGTQAPATTDLVSDFLGNQLRRPTIH